MGFGSISRVFARGKQRKSLDPGLFDGTAPDYYIEEDADWWQHRSLSRPCTCTYPTCHTCPTCGLLPVVLGAMQLCRNFRFFTSFFPFLFFFSHPGNSFVVASVCQFGLGGFFFLFWKGFFCSFFPCSFDKTWNLKDCCVSVNTRNIVHFVLVTSLVRNPLFSGAQPAGCPHLGTKDLPSWEILERKHTKTTTRKSPSLWCLPGRAPQRRPGLVVTPAGLEISVLTFLFSCFNLFAQTQRSYSN